MKEDHIQNAKFLFHGQPHNQSLIQNLAVKFRFKRGRYQFNRESSLFDPASLSLIKKTLFFQHGNLYYEKGTVHMINQLQKEYRLSRLKEISKRKWKREMSHSNQVRKTMAFFFLEEPMHVQIFVVYETVNNQKGRQENKKQDDFITSSLFV